MDIRQLEYGLKILGPVGSLFEARAIKPAHPTMQYWFSNPYNLLFHKWVEELNVAGYNMYLGKNPRYREGGSDIDVNETQCFFVDIDPIRADKTRPATEDEHRVTLKAAQDAVTWLGCGSILDSGNGHQVWCKTDLIDLRGRREWWKCGCDKLESEVRNVLAEYPVEVDQMQDIARICKMPGTMSKKGIPDADHPWREVRFVYRDETRLDVEWIMDLADESTAAAATMGSIPKVIVPQRFFDIISRDARLRESYLGQRADLSRAASESTSEQDMALVAGLRRWRFTREEAAAILRSAPNSKAREREDYVRLTIDKAFGG